MNPVDARARGIADGQRMRVFNDRGSTLVPVKVTPRIVQGVISIKEGAWFTPSNMASTPRAAPMCWRRIWSLGAVQLLTTPIWSKSMHRSFEAEHHRGGR
jgi:anaerobic selenocysteine-containing dehydrogenase